MTNQVRDKPSEKLIGLIAIAVLTLAIWGLGEIFKPENKPSYCFSHCDTSLEEIRNYNPDFSINPNYRLR